MKWCQGQTFQQWGMWQWLTNRAKGAWSCHTLKANTWTRCSQSKSKSHLATSVAIVPEVTFTAIRGIFSFIASPYSMTLMSVSIASYYCSPHSYSCQNAFSRASISCAWHAWLSLTLTSSECRITHKVRSQKSPASELVLQPPVVQFGKIARGETRMPVIPFSSLCCFAIHQSHF